MKDMNCEGDEITIEEMPFGCGIFGIVEEGKAHFSFNDFYNKPNVCICVRSPEDAIMLAKSMYRMIYAQFPDRLDEFMDAVLNSTS